MIIMGTRSEQIAQVVRRRHDVATERRRLLAHALHVEDDDDGFDDAVTTEIERQIIERPEVLVAPASDPPPERASDRRSARGTWGPQLDELRAQTAAYRAQAIALNAKLAMHEHAREELRVVRVQLAESSARIEHAVDDIDAFAALDEQLGILEPTGD
jgi:hypothetical protein